MLATTRVSIARCHLLSKQQPLPRQTKSSYQLTATNRKRRHFSDAKTSDGGGGHFFSFLSWYSRKLDTHPILTKSISSAIVMGTGDLLSQYTQAYSEQQTKTFSWDVMRTCRFSILGLAWVGPVIHGWFSTLMRWIPGVSVSSVAKRVLLDQFVFTPFCFLPSFLSGLWILEGTATSPAVLGAKLEESLPSTVVANWTLWIPAQIVNFRYIAGKYQVLFSNGTGFLWNFYLSYTIHKEKEVMKN